MVTHRTEKQILDEAEVDINTLIDPELDILRFKDRNYAVLKNKCVVRGCKLSNWNKGHFNGYYCGCCQSHYDSLGRARKGEAKKNLKIPKYEIKEINDIKYLLININLV